MPGAGHPSTGRGSCTASPCGRSQSSAGCRTFCGLRSAREVSEQQNKGLVSSCKCLCVRFQHGPAVGMPWVHLDVHWPNTWRRQPGGGPVHIPVQGARPGGCSCLSCCGSSHGEKKPHFRGFTPVPRPKSSGTPHSQAGLATHPVPGAIVCPWAPLRQGAWPPSHHVAGQPLSGGSAPDRGRGRGTAGTWGWEKPRIKAGPPSCCPPNQAPRVRDGQRPGVPRCCSEGPF